MTNYDKEVKERWGDGGAYQEYQTKTADYTEEKWQEASEGLAAVFAKFADCMKGGKTADSLEAQALVKELKNHITENYYTCTNEILAGLGEMYAADERFKKNIDSHAVGTARFAAEAIGIFCGSNEK